MNLNISGNTTINLASTFNLTCEKNINLSSNGYIHITNTNTGTDGAQEKRALVVDGGYHQKKDCVIDGDFTLAGNLNVHGPDSSLFKTEDFGKKLANTRNIPNSVVILSIFWNLPQKFDQISSENTKLQNTRT